MARIAQDEIERLKQNISLVRLAEGQGIALKKHGKDYLGCCPFHDDKTPSLVISPDKNLWHCLGACQQGGDVINWMMKSNNISFRHAVELLREGEFTTTSEPVTTKLPSPFTAPAHPAPAAGLLPRDPQEQPRRAQLSRKTRSNHGSR